MDHRIEVLLLDLGGVLVELDLTAAEDSWFDSRLSNEDNWRQWLQSADSQALERGEITPIDFARLLIERNGLDITPETFVEKFRDWVVGFYPGVLGTLGRIQTDIELGVFSNITEVHWPSLQETLIAETRIHHYFASYLIGHAKPEVSAYRYVCDQMAVAPAKVLFVDDNPVNVDGAQRAGLLAELVQGPEMLEAVLARYGLFGDGNAG